MGLVAWVAVIVIALVAIGLGWGVFFNGLVKGATMVGQNPVVQNATHETAKFVANSATTTASTNTVTVVQTEKTVYRTAEPIVIVIKNQGNQTVTFPQSSAILKIKNQASAKMYTVTITQIKTELNPGESTTVTWNQQDDSGAPVGTGTYVADVETTNSTSVGQTTFTVE